MALPCTREGASAWPQGAPHRGGDRSFGPKNNRPCKPVLVPLRAPRPATARPSPQPLTTMQLHKLSLTAALLVSSVCAQIPAPQLLVAEDSGFGNTNGLALVDMTSGQAGLVGNNKYAGHSTIALDPDRPGEIWGIGSGPTFSWPIYHYELSGTSINQLGTGAGHAPIQLQFHRARRFMVHQDELYMTLQDGNNRTSGLWVRSRDGSSTTQVSTIPDPYDLAALGDKIYVTSGSKNSELIEVDLATTPPTAKKLTLTLDPNASAGARLPTDFQCICAKGPEGIADTLILVDTSGVVYEVIPGQSSWNITTQGLQGLANPVAVAWSADPKVGFVVAVGKSVYDQINYILSTSVGKATYTSSYDITDIAMESGNVTLAGMGCAGSNGRTPSLSALSAPYLGNQSFALVLSNTQPRALTHLVLGASNKSIDLSILGAPGCFLHTDILVDLVTNTDAQGGLSVPAAVPNQASLVGLLLYAQCGSADAGANNAGLVTSNALGIHVR